MLKLQLEVTLKTLLLLSTTLKMSLKKSATLQE